MQGWLRRQRAGSRSSQRLVGECHGPHRASPAVLQANWTDDAWTHLDLIDISGSGGDDGHPQLCRLRLLLAWQLHPRLGVPLQARPGASPGPARQHPHALHFRAPSAQLPSPCVQHAAGLAAFCGARRRRVPAVQRPDPPRPSAPANTHPACSPRLVVCATSRRRRTASSSWPDAAPRARCAPSAMTRCVRAGGAGQEGGVCAAEEASVARRGRWRFAVRP